MSGAATHSPPSPIFCRIRSSNGGCQARRHGELQLPLTQEQLADAVALTSVHVNRTLMRLEEEGHVRNKR